MSILLDALRKSEQRERLGAAPDIHGSEPAPTGPERPPWLIPALLVIVVVLLLGGGYVAWRSWAQPRVPVAAPELPPETAGPLPESGAAEATTEPEASEAAADPADSVTVEPAAPRLDRQPRSPVETLSSDRPFRPAAGGATQDPGSPRPPQGEPVASSPQERDAGSSSAAALAAAAAKSQAGTPSVARPAATEASKPVARDDEPPGVVSFWQLPADVRSGLPNLKINVMVYNEDPQRRFIIMGGNRYREGAQVQRNLTLVEVRRDRALFRHGAYLFYIKQ